MSHVRLAARLASIVTAICVIAIASPRLQAAKLTVDLMPPAVDPDKPDGPGDVPGWGALVLMFSGPVTSAQFAIEDSPCPVFMDVPGFMGPSDTVTLVPPPAPGTTTGYRIPVGKKVSIMVMSDNPVTLKANPAPPGMNVNFWRYKGNNADARNRPASAIPEPGAAALAVLALAALSVASRRLRPAM